MKPKELVKRIFPLLAICALFAWSLLQKRRSHQLKEIALSSFLDFVKEPTCAIQQAIVGASQCVLILEDGRRLTARWPAMARPVAEELWAALRRSKVMVVAERTSSLPYFTFTAVVMVAYVLMVFTMLRRMTGGSNGGKRWSDDRQKVLQGQQAKGSEALVTSFNDIAGIDKAKLEVQEVVTMLKSPEQYAVLGARVPRGVLLVGPPGSGKTLLARACAAEAGLPFLNAAATEFVELFVGRGAARVRQLFERARKLAPCIVFIDEVDALRARGNDILRSGGNQEAEQTLNQLLASMDGLVARGGGGGSRPVVVVGATNRPEVLDEALLRPGRFDRVVRVELPDALGRLRILHVHLRLKQVPLGPDADEAVLRRMADQSDGLGGAALESLVNEAAIRAARRGSPTVSAADLEEALADYRRSRASRSGLPWLQ